MQIGESEIAAPTRCVVVVNDHQHLAPETLRLRFNGVTVASPAGLDGVEIRNLLQEAIFENLEIGSRKSADRRPVVQHRDVDVDNVDLDFLSE